MTSYSAYAAGRRRRNDGILSSHVTLTDNGVLLSWEWMNTCLPMGCSEWIPCFSLLVHMAFALLIKVSLSQHTNIFFFFCSSNSLPYPIWWDWESSCVGLSWWLGLKNYIYQKQLALGFRLFGYNSTLRCIPPNITELCISCLWKWSLSWTFL